MLTFYQIGNLNRKNRKTKNKRFALKKSPQKRGVCSKTGILAPKKPCSARRAICQVKLTSKRIVYCHIPGIGHNLKRFSVVLVRGGRTNDLPGIKYKVIRAARRTDLQPVLHRSKNRSKYGIKNLNHEYKKRSKTKTI